MSLGSLTAWIDIFVCVRCVMRYMFKHDLLLYHGEVSLMILRAVWMTK